MANKLFHNFLKHKNKDNFPDDVVFTLNALASTHKQIFVASARIFEVRFSFK